jgi:hypothetical protein
MGYKLVSFSILVSLLSSVLLIAAAATPHLADRGAAHLGAFRLCIDEQGCRNIGTKCDYSAADGSKILLFPSDCSKFNAVRAFLVMGLMIQILHLLLMLCSALRSKLRSFKMSMFTLVIGVLASFCFIASFASWANATPNRRSFRGNSFILLVVGWLCQTFSTFAFYVASRRMSGNNASISKSNQSAISTRM